MSGCVEAGVVLTLLVILVNGTVRLGRGSWGWLGFSAQLGRFPTCIWSAEVFCQQLEICIFFIGCP